MTDPKNQTNTTDAALPPVDDYATATEALPSTSAESWTSTSLPGTGNSV